MSLLAHAAIDWLRAGDYGTLCTICGYDLGSRAGSPDAPSCPSCGCLPHREAANGGIIRIVTERAGWIYTEMPWHGDPLPPPAGWDPVVQLRRVHVDLGESYASWRATLPPPIDSAHLPDWTALLEKRLALLQDPFIALEAFWDGDSSGWFVVLCAITDRPSSSHLRYSSTDLLVVRPRMGDRERLARLTSMSPDAWLILEIVGAAARERGIPFHFVSPDRPDDECPRWWDLRHA